METNNSPIKPIASSIEPWLTLSDGPKAVVFYKAAFGAVETYRMEAPDGGLVVKFAVGGAGFWISSDASSQDAPPPGEAVKIILTVTDPDTIFAQALEAGAIEIFPIGEDYGWRLGRLADPFGYHWEIGRPLDK